MIDYCFCDRKDCPKVGCMRQRGYAPVGKPYSVSLLYSGKNFDECEWYMPHESFLKDLNQATFEDLVAIGLGKTKATNVIRARDERVRFGSMDEVTRLRGIGPTTYKLLRENYYVEEIAFSRTAEREICWLSRMSEATSVISAELKTRFGNAVRNLRFEHVDESGYWFTFELAQDSRRQTYCVRHGEV